MSLDSVSFISFTIYYTFIFEWKFFLKIAFRYDASRYKFADPYNFDDFSSADPALVRELIENCEKVNKDHSFSICFFLCGT